MDYYNKREMNMIELTQQDIQNILVLLDRVSIKGLKEVQILSELCAKLSGVGLNKIEEVEKE
jgi:hypothetical protein